MPTFFSCHGGGFGHQAFFKGGRAQLVVEVAGRTRYDSLRDGAVGVGLRFQHAIGRRMILRLDGYGGDTRNAKGFAGGRSELVIKF